METSSTGRLGEGQRGYSGDGPSAFYLVLLPCLEWECHKCPARMAAVLPFQVAECLQDLRWQLQELQAEWTLCQQRYKQTWDLQKLRQGLEQAEAWLASREGLLLEPSCGVSGDLPRARCPLAVMAQDRPYCCSTQWSPRLGSGE